MIIYFSATGTSKYVAQEIALSNGDKMIPLKHLVRNHAYSITLKDGEDFGIITPTYWEGLPSIILDYMEKVNINIEGDQHYCYLVATYGCDYGNILSTAQKVFSAKGIMFDSLYAARFVDNWSPMFNLKNQMRNRMAEQNGKVETKKIVKAIINKESGHYLPDQMTKFQADRAKNTYDGIRKTKYFSVSKDKCIGCGLCERQCPTEAIKMQDGHPVWIKDTCTLCLGCFHRCPVGP